MTTTAALTAAQRCALARIASLPTPAQTKEMLRGINPDTSRNAQRTHSSSPRRKVIR